MSVDPELRPEMEDAPPILGSWPKIYALVMGTLGLLIAAFWVLTQALS